MKRMVSIGKATLYEQYRLPYAHAAVSDLLECAGEVKVVADIGAGTGQLAKLFAERCSQVYAIEPEPAMRQVASYALADFPTIEIRAGFAEQTSLAEDSVDLIVIGNAFHRFKPEACDELRRILKKSGWIALFTYQFTSRGFSEMLSAKLAGLSDVASRINMSWRRTPVQALFGEGQIQTMTYPQSQPEDWTAFWGAACAGL